MELLTDYGSDSEGDKASKEPAPSAKEEERPPQKSLRPGATFNGLLTIPVLLPGPARKQLEALYKHLFATPSLAGLETVCDPLSPAHIPGRQVQFEYHVSLSRSLVLEPARFESLRRALLEAVSKHRSYTAACKGLSVLTNDAATRTFLCTPMQRGREQTCSLIESLNSILLAYHQPAFYEQPEPHISLAYLQGQRRRQFTSAIRHLEQDPGHRLLLPEWEFAVKNVELRSGKRTYLLWLQKCAL